MTRSPRSLVSGLLVAAGLGVSAVAVVGLALTAAATPMVGIVLQPGAPDAGQQPAASGNGAIDNYEEALDRPLDPLTADSRAVIDTDRERAQFAALQDDCMAEAGFDWWDAARGNTPAGEPWWLAEISPNEATAVYAALHGESAAAEYRWEQAGCYGYALHETGNDNNH
ncbi:hypothetical protein [Microterricola viridarii]|uniref:Uncharacterized protein n=1 Tax=Microterricola viridarii TaxID=412690 RepID=A0A1H1N3K5_9MICO|nr:hypothetical protein [Microterricola viridarii]SDR93564.1 hypothetical protein SAMN04489834_0552 [Microterricola viridarii]